MRRYSIGRATTNDIVIDDMTVSRSHAEFEETGRGRYMLRDHDSTYGTKILRDGEWIEVIEVEVSSGTQVRFGEYEVNVGEIVATVDGDATYMPRRPEGEAAAPAAAPGAAPEAAPGQAVPKPAAPRPAAPKAPKPPKPPKAPKVPRPAAGGPGAPDKRMTMLILYAGGGAAVLLLLIAILLIAIGGGSGTTTAGGPGTIGGVSPPGGGGNPPGGGGGGGGGNPPGGGGGGGGGGGAKPPGGDNPPGGGGGGNGGGGGGGSKSSFMATCKTLAKRPDTECECAWGIVEARLGAGERRRFVLIVQNRSNAAKIQELLKDMTAEQRLAFGKKMSAVGTEIQQKCNTQ